MHWYRYKSCPWNWKRRYRVYSLFQKFL